MATAHSQELDTFLARFSLSSFRAGQREVISSVLAGEDCLCIMPTGGGKSLCYQLPAVAREGLALVVSPLIALMKDQVDSLLRHGLKATFINSSLDTSEQGERIRRIAQGEYDLVYVAPERFRDSRFLDALASTRVQLLAVDEAHCISEWGHDFRPDYARLGQFRRKLGEPQTIALTATATARVRQDVIDQLRLRNPATFITGFARPNLEFSVLLPNGDAEKEEALVAFIEENPGSGIVYSATRKRCESLAESLSQRLGCRAMAYHAGMLPEERRDVQERFMRGDLRLIVATNAFGMGIDKSNLRFVAHFNLTGSLEAYYQEAGRAGRDGMRARCLLLYSPQDRYLQEFFIENAFPSRETIEAVYEFLRQTPSNPIELSQQDIKESLGLKVGNEAIGACEQILERNGALERLDSRQNMASVRLECELSTLIDRVPRAAKNQRKLVRGLEALLGARREERVFFSLPRLFAAAELEADAGQRALREVARIPGLDYVPPFRGRALHITNRAKPFRELTIDFKKLDERRSAEFDKLDRMVRYATLHRCRQLEFLNYFGDPNAEECGICDNCHSRAPKEGEGGTIDRSVASASVASAGVASASVASAGVKEAVRKALAGVARSKGRFGKTMVAQMLCGSKSTKLSRGGLNRLSTFGILAPLKQDETIEFLDALLTAGLLEQVEETRLRPLLKLTPYGDEVMRGVCELNRPLNLSPMLLAKLPSASASGGAVVTASGGVAEAAVVSREREVASPEETPPAPATQEATEGRESGLLAEGEARFADTERPRADLKLDDFFSSIGEGESCIGDVDAAPDEDEWSQGIEPEGAVVADSYWTWRLLAAGFSPQECGAIRKIPLFHVWDHALEAATEGREIRIEWFLKAAEIKTLEGLLAQGAGSSLAWRLKNLPLGIEPIHVRLYLQAKAQRRSLE